VVVGEQLRPLHIKLKDTVLTPDLYLSLLLREDKILNVSSASCFQVATILPLEPGWHTCHERHAVTSQWRLLATRCCSGSQMDRSLLHYPVARAGRQTRSSLLRRGLVQALSLWHKQTAPANQINSTCISTTDHPSVCNTLHPWEVPLHSDSKYRALTRFQRQGCMSICRCDSAM
jgi:hypothetical protein